jgi:hypothetical protein
MSENLTLIRTALSKARGLAGQFRYGGLYSLWRLLGQALEALDEVEEHLRQSRLELPLLERHP